MQIKRACLGDETVLAQLAVYLWPDNDISVMVQEFRNLLTNQNAVCFLAEEQKTAVGFAQCQLRYDYVEGTESTPVGYLEGIYVHKAYQGQGAARQLLRACENWACGMGCSEFASDCELINLQSQSFHEKMGFTEANRIVCYTKKL